MTTTTPTKPKKWGMHPNGARIYSNDITSKQRQLYLAASNRANDYMKDGMKPNDAWQLAIMVETGQSINTTLSGR